MKNGPPGVTYLCSDYGWITKKLFMEWLKQFERLTKPLKEDPVLLVLDNHSSPGSLTVSNFRKEKGVSMITINSE